MRDIVVHSMQFNPWSHATEFAARLASMLKAALTGLSCIDPAAPRATHALEESVACRDLFRSWSASLGVGRSDWIACEASPAEALQHVGAWHDLLVLGAGGDSPWGSESALAAILVSSQRPCLIVPESRLQGPRLDRIALAWDGSVSALRALHASLPLLVRSGKVVVLVGGEQVRQSRSLPLFDLSRYCERHELHIERVRFAPAVGPTGGALLSAAMAENVDLLVLGGFGHSRLREWALGGVSRHVLAHSPIPLLMRH
jgi:nucleotide-binding universal stress UspA family protein